MTDIDRNGPERPESDTRNKSGQKEEGSPASSRRRTISDTMMQALEDDMDRRPGVYRRLAAS